VGGRSCAGLYNFDGFGGRHGAATLRMGIAIAGAEAAGFTDTGAQAIDYRRYGVQSGAANGEDHERSFDRGVHAGSDAHALHAGLFDEVRGMGGVHDSGAGDFGVGNGIDQLRGRGGLLEGGAFRGGNRAAASEEIAFDDAGANAVDLGGKVGAGQSFGDEEKNGGFFGIVVAGADADGLDFGVGHKFGDVGVAGGGGYLQGSGGGRQGFDGGSGLGGKGAADDGVCGGVADEGDAVGAALEEIEDVGNRIADGVGIGACEEEGYGIGGVLGDDEGAGIAFGAEAAADDVHLVGVVDVESSARATALLVLDAIYVDGYRQDRRAGQAGGTAAFGYGMIEDGGDAGAGMRSIGNGNTVGIHGGAEQGNVSRGVYFVGDHLGESRVDGGKRASFKIVKCGKIGDRCGGADSAGAGIDEAGLDDGFSERGAIAAGEDVIIAEEVLDTVLGDQRAQRAAAAGDGVSTLAEIVGVAAGSAQGDGDRLCIFIGGEEGYRAGTGVGGIDLRDGCDGDGGGDDVVHAVGSGRNAAGRNVKSGSGDETGGLAAAGDGIDLPVDGGVGGSRDGCGKLFGGENVHGGVLLVDGDGDLGRWDGGGASTAASGEEEKDGEAKDKKGCAAHGIPPAGRGDFKLARKISGGLGNAAVRTQSWNGCLWEWMPAPRYRFRAGGKGAAWDRASM